MKKMIAVCAILALAAFACAGCGEKTAKNDTVEAATMTPTQAEQNQQTLEPSATPAPSIDPTETPTAAPTATPSVTEDGMTLLCDVREV